MNKVPDNTMSKYRFVMLAALRAEQLQAGAIPRIDSDTRKATVLAQEEVAAGVVDAWDGSRPAGSGADASADE
jgi:DNA-directed RNA polymerase omega subunit